MTDPVPKPVTRTWHQRIAGPYTDELMDAIQERMAAESVCWMQAYGYRSMTASWEIDHSAAGHWAGETVVTLIVEMRPIMDGVWGDLRAALAEDGLLPARDRAWLPVPPKTPAVGEMRIGLDPAGDGSTVGVIHVWDGKVWRDVTDLTSTAYLPGHLSFGPYSLDGDGDLTT